MTTQQIQKYNSLMRRREQLANFIYVSDFALANNDITLIVAVRMAENTIAEIDNEIAKL